MLRNQVGFSYFTLQPLISGDNNFSDALSGDNNFTDAGQLQLVRCHGNVVTL
jgi:hypothetical protein